MVRKTQKRQRNGFTLAEVMITVAIMSVMFMVIPSLIANMTKFTRLNAARLETERSARDSLSQINRNLRQASASTVSISQESGQPPYSSIQFTTVDGAAMKYYQDGKDLYVVQNGSTHTFASGLRFIAFGNLRTDDSTIISVSVTFEKETYQGGSKALQMAVEKVRVMN